MIRFILQIFIMFPLGNYFARSVPLARLPRFLLALCLLTSLAYVDTFIFSVSTDKNLYQTLEITRDSSKDEIKAQKRQLLLKYHPDKAPKHLKEEYSEISISLNNYVDILKKRETRDKYDYFEITDEEPQGTEQTDQSKKD